MTRVFVSRYEHSADLGWKASSEGSLQELIFGYGLSMDELPNDMPPPIRAKIKQLLAVDPVLREVKAYLEKAVSEYDYSKWESAESDGHLPNCSRSDRCAGEGQCR